MTSRASAFSFSSGVLFSFAALSCGGIAVSTEDDLRLEEDSSEEPGPGPLDPDPVPPRPTPRPDPVEPPEPPVDCSGSFAEPVVLFEDSGWISQALTPSANGLEFFYARLAMDSTLSSSGTREPTLRTRPSLDSDFGEPVTLVELITACESVRPGTELAGLDLSNDRLRLYIACSTFLPDPGSTGPLLMVERETDWGPFSLPPKVVGEVGISLGLTRDELTAFGTSLDPAIGAVLWYKRSSVSEFFGPGEVIPGAISLYNPEPSPDLLELWGAVDVPGTVQSQIAVSQFNEDTQSFAPPQPFGAPPPVGATDFSPALSRDCRTLYFSRYTNSPSPLSQVMVAGR